MSTAMPELHASRLLIRPFTMDDLEDVHRVLCAAWQIPAEKVEQSLPNRAAWLRWTVANYDGLADLDQPPYGDRAIVLRDEGTLIGSLGLVPALGPFGQLPGFPVNEGSDAWYAEVGLFWSIDPARQRRGYATEAAAALVEYAFKALHLGRIIATTEYENEASMRVMTKLGMELLRNARPEPHWFQVVGLLERDVPRPPIGPDSTGV